MKPPNQQTKCPALSHPINAFLWMKLRFSATKAYENHAIVKFLESIGARLGLANWWGRTGVTKDCQQCGFV